MPIVFQHAPSATKLPKLVDAAQIKAHREEQKQKNLNAYALSQMNQITESVNRARRIHFCGDGSYTNQAILHNLPEDSLYIGRLRNEAVLHYPPKPKACGANGRPRSYGDLAPTPEQLRQDDAIAWQKVEAHPAGKCHSFKIKTLGPVQWRKIGA